MNSKELLKIKKTSKIKKVLFINPKRRDCKSIVPHNGLAILSGILKKRGHKVLIVDYQLIHDAPEVSTFINDFKPDVLFVGMTAPKQEKWAYQHFEKLDVKHDFRFRLS